MRLLVFTGCLGLFLGSIATTMSGSCSANRLARLQLLQFLRVISFDAFPVATELRQILDLTLLLSASSSQRTD